MVSFCFTTVCDWLAKAVHFIYATLLVRFVMLITTLIENRSIWENNFWYYFLRNLLEIQTGTPSLIMISTHQFLDVTFAFDQKTGMNTYQWELNSMAVKVTKCFLFQNIILFLSLESFSKYTFRIHIQRRKKAWSESRQKLLRFHGTEMLRKM